MTLREWEARNPRTTVEYKDGIARVFEYQLIHRFPEAWNLYHLEDWHVTSAVSGPALVLLPGSSLEPHRAVA